MASGSGLGGSGSRFLKSLTATEKFHLEVLPPLPQKWCDSRDYWRARTAPDILPQVNWKDLGAIRAPTRNQDRREECLHIAFAAAVQSQLFIRTGIDETLSPRSSIQGIYEQYYHRNEIKPQTNKEKNTALKALLKNGPLVDVGINDLMRFGMRHGIAVESDWPYDLRVPKRIPFDKVQIASYKFCKSVREVKERLRDHPLICVMQVTATFTDLKEEIYTLKQHRKDKDKRDYHAMLLVGWESNNLGEYWIVHNSWGTEWGNNGFGLIQCDSDDKAIPGGIFASVSYPELLPQAYVAADPQHSC